MGRKAQVGGGDSLAADGVRQQKPARTLRTERTLIVHLRDCGRVRRYGPAMSGAHSVGRRASEPIRSGRTLWRRRGAAVLAAGALLLSVGCGDDDDVVIDGAATIETPGTSVTGSSDGDGDGDEDSDAADGSANEVELDEVVLGVDDLPEGWTEVPAEETESGGGCLDALTAAGGPFDLDTAPTSAFAQSKLGPFLAAAVVEGAADDVLAEVDDVLVSCDGSEGDDGFTTVIEPAALDGLPPASLAVRGTSKDSSGSGVVFTLAAAGTNEVSVMVLAATPLGEIDDAIVATAIDAMLARAPADS